MDVFEKKTLKTSRGFTYTYYVADGDKSLPALFFQHGWPDHAAMWAQVANMLGYDGTDKPTDPRAYKFDVMTRDLIEIIDAEGHEKVISIGHDWGSTAASRLYNYHPDRVAGLINLNVAYTPPSRQPFDLDAYNKLTEAAFGYPIFSYWYLFSAPEGPEVLMKNVDRLYHAMHGQVDTMKHIFTGRDAMREYLTNGGIDIKLRAYAQDADFKKTFIDRMTRDGFEGPQCWYKAAVQNIQHESDKNLPEGREKVEVSVLYIGAKEDPVCRPEGLIPSIQKGLLPHLEQTDLIDAAHWTTYEKPQEVVERIEPWLKKHFQK